jgi:hypothetical protein
MCVIIMKPFKLDFDDGQTGDTSLLISWVTISYVQSADTHAREAME